MAGEGNRGYRQSMPDRSRTPGKKRDLNQRAFDIVQAICDDEEKAPDEAPPKDPAAVALGRRGGLKGGKARAAKMTDEQRSASARNAARARWEKKPTS